MESQNTSFVWAPLHVCDCVLVCVSKEYESFQPTMHFFQQLIHLANKLEWQKSGSSDWIPPLLSPRSTRPSPWLVVTAVLGNRADLDPPQFNLADRSYGNELVGERKGVWWEEWMDGKEGSPYLPQEHHVLPVLPGPNPSFSWACLIEGPAVTVKGF